MRCNWNSESAYPIVNAHDYRIFRENEIKLANLEARQQAFSSEGESFESIGDLMADLHARVDSSYTSFREGLQGNRSQAFR